MPTPARSRTRSTRSPSAAKCRSRVVSNSRMRVPDHPLVERMVVSRRVRRRRRLDRRRGRCAATVVITGDILLADRCLKAGATVIGHNGKPFTAASIGAAIATRAIMADLRAGRRRGSAVRRRSPRRTARGSCRRSTKRWCGWRGPSPGGVAVAADALAVDPECLARGGLGGRTARPRALRPARTRPRSFRSASARTRAWRPGRRPSSATIAARRRSPALGRTAATHRTSGGTNRPRGGLGMAIL